MIPSLFSNLHNSFLLHLVILSLQYFLLPEANDCVDNNWVICRCSEEKVLLSIAVSKQGSKGPVLIQASADADLQDQCWVLKTCFTAHPIQCHRWNSSVNADPNNGWMSSQLGTSSRQQWSQQVRREDVPEHHFWSIILSFALGYK